MNANELLKSLPEPIRTKGVSTEPSGRNSVSKESNVRKAAVIPPHGQRGGWRPRSVADFGDGGAFPEIHVAQYPLDMGRKDRGVVAVRPQSVQSKAALDETEEDPDAVAIHRKNRSLRATVGAAPVSYVRVRGATSEDDRLVRISERPADPLEPPKFRSQASSGQKSKAAPVPVLRSPPRAVSAAEMESWRIPPCLSNWTNQNGYTVPLEQRVAADGREKVQESLSTRFAEFTEALYVAERKAREEVNTRHRMMAELQDRLRTEREVEQQRLAEQIILEQDRIKEEESQDDHSEAEEGAEDRAWLREERKRERDRQRRLQSAEYGQKRARAEADRDVSERVALGQNVAGGEGGFGEVVYDQRLFQRGALGPNRHGFGDEEDDQHVYEGPGLLAGRVASTLYRPSVELQNETAQADEDLRRALDTSRFKPDRGFAGAESTERSAAAKRAGPVQFTKGETTQSGETGAAGLTEELFGLDAFMGGVSRSTGRTFAAAEAARPASAGRMSASAGSDPSALRDMPFDPSAKVQFVPSTKK